MKRFNSAKWITEHKHGTHLSDDVLLDIIVEHISHEYVGASLLNEGKIKDFFGNLKSKIKDNNKFIAFLASLKAGFKDIPNALTGLQVLKQNGLLKGLTGANAQENAQVLLDKLEGKEQSIKEAADKEYQKKTEELDEEEVGTLRKFLLQNKVGKFIKNVTVVALFYSMFGAAMLNFVKQVAPDSSLSQGTQTTQALDQTQWAAYANHLKANTDLNSDEIADELKTVGGKNYNIQAFGGAGADTRFFIDKKTGEVEDKTPETEPTDTPKLGDLATDTNKVSEAEKRGLKINITGDQTANIAEYPFGSSKSTSAQESKWGTENQTIVQFLLNGQDYQEIIVGQSSNTGPNSNDDNSTGQKDALDTNRANTNGNWVMNDLKQKLDEKDIKYTSTDTSITLEDGTVYTQERSAGQDPSKLQKVKKGLDNEISQNSLRVGEAGPKESTPIPDKPVTLMDFDPVAVAPTGGGGKPIVPPPPSTFLKVNRKSQIAIMLGVINGESNIYALIRQDEKAKNTISAGNQADSSSLTETEYFKLAGMRGEENTPSNPKLVELSKLIIALEKEKSESIRKMVNQAYGKEVLLRGAKVRQTSPGVARKPQFTTGKISTAENHLFNAYLNDIQEGIVSDLLPNFINQSQVNNKKLEIVGYYGSMYAAEGSTSDAQLSTIQLDVLQSIDKNAQKELGKQGFDSSTLGLTGTKDSPDAGKYQFLNKDVENIKKKIDNNSVLVNKIKLVKTEKDLKCLIKLIYSLFQDQFSSSQSSTQKLKQVGTQIKEEEDISPLCKDISKILSRQEFELAFGKVNTVKELEETILKVVIPLIDPNLQKNKALIKRSIAQAAKDIEDQNRKQKTDTPDKPSSGFSSSTTSTTGKVDINKDKFEYVPALYTTKEGKRKSLKTLAEELGYIK
jgi:hypothetical protein